MNNTKPVFFGLKHKTILLIIASCLVVFAFLLIAHLRLREYAFDDAYIHFRIAENFVEYGEPYYNPGEPVMASSSPGWTILLTIFLLIGKLFSWNVDLVLWVAVFNAVMTALGGFVYTLLLAKLLQKSNHWLAYVLFFVTYESLIIFASIGLMETPLAMLLVGIGIYLLSSRSMFSFTLLSVSVFFRPELLIVFGLTSVYAILKRYFRYTALVSYSLSGILPFIVYDLFFFRTVIPGTIMAKSIVYTLSFRDSMYSFLSQFSDFTLPSSLFTIPLQWMILYAFLSIWILGVLFSIFVLQQIRSIRNYPAGDVASISLLIGLWGCVTCIFYYLSKTVIFPWYTPMFSIPIAIAVMITLFNGHPKGITWGLWIITLPIFFGVFENISTVALAAADDPSYYLYFEEGARTRHYISLGDKLYKSCPESELMASEIGGLGYGFKGYLLDGAGLITPEALDYHPLSIPDERCSGMIGAIPVNFIATMRPEIIVSYDIFIEAFLQCDWENSYERYKLPGFLEDDLRFKPNATVWGSRNLNLLVRWDSSCELDLK